MPSVRTFIEKHSLPTYVALTFAISWGGVLALVGPGGLPATPEQTQALLPFVVLATLAGPSVAGLLLTGLAHGRSGRRAFRSRLLRWRVGARWYAIALAFAPLLVTVVLLALSLFSPDFLPGLVTADDRATLLLVGIGYGLAVGFFEELGWTGFAVPWLRRRHGVLTTGLTVGLVWGAWHFLVALWGSGDPSGAFSLALFVPWIPWNLAVLPAYRVLMVWVFDRTESLPVAALMHASLTASLPLILAPAATGAALTSFYLILAVALWAVVVVVTRTSGRPVSREPHPRSLA